MAMQQSKSVIAVQLEGLRPLMFDCYAGDNSTQLPVAEKMYLAPDMGLMMPALNVLSLLAAENTKSVCRQFFGKNGKTIALGISSFTTISPFDIPICDDDGPIHYSGWNAQISQHKAVARLPKGIPNAKERPVWPCLGGWTSSSSILRISTVLWRTCGRRSTWAASWGWARSAPSLAAISLRSGQLTKLGVARLGAAGLGPARHGGARQGGAWKG